MDRKEVVKVTYLMVDMVATIMVDAWCGHEKVDVDYGRSDDCYNGRGGG